ncbi:MAG TPA: hypothetical protein VFG50_00155 [Rhodothermales bacterium]|nr:hypothetical protein [Rhodothermales bacterium]
MDSNPYIPLNLHSISASNLQETVNYYRERLVPALDPAAGEAVDRMRRQLEAAIGAMEEELRQREDDLRKEEQ